MEDSAASCADYASSWCTTHATLKTIMNHSSTTLRLPITPSRQRDRTSGISPTRRPPLRPAPQAPKMLAPDSLAWAMQTAAACVTEVIAFGRSLMVVLSELRQRDLPPNAVRAQ